MKNNCTGKVELIGDKIRFTFEYPKPTDTSVAVSSGMLEDVTIPGYKITGANMAANFYPVAVKQPSKFDSLESWEFICGTFTNYITKIDGELYWCWGKSGEVTTNWTNALGWGDKFALNSLKYFNEYLTGFYTQEERREIFRKFKGENVPVSPKVNFTFKTFNNAYSVVEKILTDDDVADIDKSDAGVFYSKKRPKPIVGRRAIVITRIGVDVFGRTRVGLSMCNPEDTWDSRTGVELAILNLCHKSSELHEECMKAFDKWWKENG